jgi:histidinol-phosphatase (PHP family)
MADTVTWSYHTHNQYCDGEATIEEMVQAAIEAGLTQIGISSHAPLPFETAWNMPPSRLSQYIQEVREIRRRYRNRIDVLLGLEVDFIPDPHVAQFQQQEIFTLDVDFFVGSVHFLGSGYPPRSFDGGQARFDAILHADYGGDIEAMVTDYYSRLRQMLRMPHVKIVGHMDRIKRWNADNAYWREDEPWYPDAVDEALRAIAASGQLVELNTGGWRKGHVDTYPSPWILSRCRDYSIPVTVSSDAHTPGEVTWGFDRAEQCLTELGITPVRLAVVSSS